MSPLLSIQCSAPSWANLAFLKFDYNKPSVRSHLCFVVLLGAIIRHSNITESPCIWLRHQQPLLQWSVSICYKRVNTPTSIPQQVIIDHQMLISDSTQQKIQAIQNSAESIKYKYQHSVNATSSVDETLLNLINNVTLIKNLSKDALSFLDFTTPEERKEAFQSLGYLSVYAPQLLERPVNQVWYLKTLDVVKGTLEEISKADLKDRMLINFLEQKLKLFLVIYRYAITFDNEDIFSLSKNNQRWEYVSKFTHFKVLAPAQEVLNEIESFRKGIKTATALLQKASKSQNQAEKLLSFILGGIHYFFDQSQRNKKNIEFKSDMEINKVRTMVNFFEDGFSKMLMKIALPFIAYNKKIYIKYGYRSISKNTVLEWMKRGYAQIELDQPKEKIEADDKKLFNKQKDNICIRVLCYKDFERSKQTKKKFSKVILHVHGGGFIGFSSRSHQLYTRKWVKQAKLPVFSVDYRKAPQTPYPGPLDDCWQAYNWILNQSHKYFNIEEKKEIILAGDSAGGNMIMGITNLCIQLGIQKPCAVLAFYPALNLLMENFTPSLMYSLEDPLLSFEFLFLCLRSYVPGSEFKPGKDYLISPIFTPDDVLKFYPPVRIFSGQMDPLYDDSIRFAVRLSKNEVDIKMVSYQNMVHGYLQLDVPGGITYAEKCVEDSIESIKSFK